MNGTEWLLVAEGGRTLLNKGSVHAELSAAELMLDALMRLIKDRTALA